MERSNNKNSFNSQKKLVILVIACLILLFLILGGIVGNSRLDMIPYIPNTTPKEWCEVQPCVELDLFSNKIIIVQPSSTFLVYFLGILTICIGLYIIRIRNYQKSHLWWGIALLLWGLGALSAGTSYQAFSFEIKCAGREFCVWTSWWEVIYLMLSVGSVDAMIMAQAYSCTTEKWRKIISTCAFVIITSYIITTLIGVFIPIKFLISFELMILFLGPIILIFFITNGWRYMKYKKSMDLALVGTWISLGIIIGIYFLYFLLGITELLWEHGIWFSENDVLHIGLMIWMVYIGIIVTRYVKDMITQESG